MCEGSCKSHATKIHVIMMIRNVKKQRIRLRLPSQTSARWVGYLLGFLSRLLGNPSGTKSWTCPTIEVLLTGFLKELFRYFCKPQTRFSNTELLSPEHPLRITHQETRSHSQSVPWLHILESLLERPLSLPPW